MKKITSFDVEDEVMRQSMLFNVAQNKVVRNAGSLVSKPDWEAEEDRKDTELNEFLVSIGMSHLTIGTK